MARRDKRNQTTRARNTEPRDDRHDAVRDDRDLALQRERHVEDYDGDTDVRDDTDVDDRHGREIGARAGSDVDYVDEREARGTARRLDRDDDGIDDRVDHDYDRTDRRARRRVHADDDVVVERTASDAGVREARRGFGGLDVPASLLGMLSALAMVVILAGLVGAAIGAVGYQMGVEGAERELSIAGLVGGLIVLFLAFFVGGWAAGRMARYDGVLNGSMTAVWAILLAAVLAGVAAVLGNEYDVFANVSLPQFFSRDAMTIGGIVTAVLAIAAMIGGGALGGKRGERYHREADATIAGTRDGGLT